MSLYAPKVLPSPTTGNGMLRLTSKIHICGRYVPVYKVFRLLIILALVFFCVNPEVARSSETTKCFNLSYLDSQECFRQVSKNLVTSPLTSKRDLYTELGRINCNSKQVPVVLHWFYGPQ